MGWAAAIAAIFTFLYKLPEIRKAFSKTPEQKKEAIDQSISDQEKKSAESGRPSA